MSMSRSFQPFDRQPQSTADNHWQQVPMAAMLAAILNPQLLPLALIRAASFLGCLNEAARHSGMDDHEIAEKCCVSAGYFSRYMRTVGQQQAKRLVAFMRATNSLAPLQWLAEQMGCDLVHRATVSTELAEARARVAELERQGRSAA